MASNECIPYMTGEDALTVEATADVVGCTMVNVSADKQVAFGALSSTADGGNVKVATAAAGAKALGVAAYDFASGKKGKVWYQPGLILPVTAGAGGVTAGQQVEVGAAGKVITLASGIAVGQVLTTALANALTLVKLY